MEEAPLLVTVQRIVSRIEIKHQFFWRALEASDELLQDQSVNRPIHRTRGAVLQAASVGAEASTVSRSQAVCIRGSTRSIA
jgi:hypothetical protein